MAADSPPLDPPACDRIPGIVRPPGEQIIGFGRVRKFWKVRLRKQDRTGALQARDAGGIRLGDATLEDRGAALGQHPCGIDLILRRDGHTMQRAKLITRHDRCFRRLRGFERAATVTIALI